MYWDSGKVYERKIATFSLVIVTARRYYVHGTFAQNRNRTWRQCNGSCNFSCNPRQYRPDINMSGDDIVTYFTNDLLIPQRVLVRVYTTCTCVSRRLHRCYFSQELTTVVISTRFIAFAYYTAKVINTRPPVRTRY